MQVLEFFKQIYNHPANQGKKFTAISQALSWQTYKRILKNPRVLDFHGLKFLAFPDSSAASSVVYFNCLPDYDEMQFIKRKLKPGDNFIDIGANIGIYSLLAASLVGDSGSVHAFEANPAMANKLKQQINYNKLSNIHLYNLAVADQNGKMQFVLTKDDCTAHITNEDSYNKDLITVNTVTLDQCLPQKKFAMGKMDIEGAEILALKGAENLLQAANPSIWQLELAGYTKRHGYRSDQVLEYLNEFDYRCAVYNSTAQKLEYIDKPWQLGIKNILAIHKKNSLLRITS